MKKLGLFDKFIFFLNSLAATALLFSYLLPLIPPKSFPLLSVLSLGVPVLIMLNALFLVYWIFRLKRQVLLSLIVLILGYNYVTSFVKFSGAETDEKKDSDFSLMSYNVRMFNAYEWSPRQDLPKKITAFIKEQNPDILCVQEHYIGAAELSDIYPYEYIKLKDKNAEFGSAIFSKYPIINRGSLDFPQDGNNNAIYTDILINEKDTLRIFNVHFQSLNIKPGIDDLQKEDSKKLLGRIGYGFSLQQEQAELLVKDLEKSPYKTLIAGDFNNTSFSYIYDLVKQERFKDAFLEAGTGFGKSFKLNYFPLRIDFLLIEENMKINEFRKFEVDYSDHYPVLTKIEF